MRNSAGDFERIVGVGDERRQKRKERSFPARSVLRAEAWAGVRLPQHVLRS